MSSSNSNHRVVVVVKTRVVRGARVRREREMLLLARPTRSGQAGTQNGDRACMHNGGGPASYVSHESVVVGVKSNCRPHPPTTGVLQ